MSALGDTPHQLHHLALGASDVGRLADFYGQVLGLRELKRHYLDDGSLRSVWLELGGVVLMLEHTDQQRTKVPGVDAGLFLFAIHMNQSDQVAFESELLTRGHALESKTDHTRYFRDPEGNRFAISSYETPSQDRVSLTSP